VPLGFGAGFEPVPSQDAPINRDAAPTIMFFFVAISNIHLLLNYFNASSESMIYQM
jgi:hypothetical protein